MDVSYLYTNGSRNSNQITREKEITVINIAKYVSFMFYVSYIIHNMNKTTKKKDK